MNEHRTDDRQRKAEFELHDLERRAEDGRVELTGLTRAAGVPFIPARVKSLEL
jgi:hypothetical protein